MHAASNERVTAANKKSSTSLIIIPIPHILFIEQQHQCYNNLRTWSPRKNGEMGTWGWVVITPSVQHCFMVINNAPCSTNNFNNKNIFPIKTKFVASISNAKAQKRDINSNLWRVMMMSSNQWMKGEEEFSKQTFIEEWKNPFQNKNYMRFDLDDLF